MGRLDKKKRLIIERVNRKMLGESEMECPNATNDSDLNERNKNKITNNNGYGVPTDEAKEKGQSCANCVAFDISKRMKDCMDNDSGDIGYCWMHDFMCSGVKWCDTWTEGGPITSDDESYKKQQV